MEIHSVGISFCRDFVLTGFRSHGPKSLQSNVLSPEHAAMLMSIQGFVATALPPGVTV